MGSKVLSFKNTKKSVKKFFDKKLQLSWNSDDKSKKSLKDKVTWNYDSEFFPKEAREKTNLRRNFSLMSLKNPSNDELNMKQKFYSLGRKTKFSFFNESDNLSLSSSTLSAQFPNHA